LVDFLFFFFVSGFLDFAFGFSGFLYVFGFFFFSPFSFSRGPLTRRFFSSSGVSAVITRRSRAIAPFDGTYVDQPLSPSTRLEYLKPTQSSRLYASGLPSNSRASRLVVGATRAPTLLRPSPPPIIGSLVFPACRR
jgi:hypothetical protein